jgi:hypothetical protein
MLDQAEFMRHFNEMHREDFNPKLFERDNEDIVESIREVVYSCQRDKYYTLKVLSFKAIYDYEEIYNTLRDHEEKRRKKNSKVENSYDFINIRDTDIILIKVEWLVRHNGIERVEENNKTYEVAYPEEVLEVLIAVPRFTRKYYFRIAGNYYTTIFQIVDGSTYNNSTASQSKVDTVTLKTMFMPIRIFRGFNEKMRPLRLNDKGEIVADKELKVIEYQSIIFNTTVNVIYYILAAFGFYQTSAFLEIYCVNIDTKPTIRDDYYCFEHHGIYISCPKVCFDNDAVVQSYVATLYNGIRKDTDINKITDQRYWLENLGMAYKNASIEKGLYVLDSLEGIYDNITREDLHLPMKDKENIFCILRWLIREFSNLRIKENTDVRNKRIRIADYIAAVYANKLNKGIHRISDLGSRVTLKKVIQAIYTNPSYVVQNVSTKLNNLVSYRDLVNDLDSLVALKYTYKGISGLGEDGASIQPIYRYVDPSHVGILDLDASSASDPGMSGMICPMVQLYGKDNSFSEYQEPNSWRDEFKPYNDSYYSNTTSPISFTRELPPTDYMAMREKIIQEELDIKKITCPVRNISDPNILYTCSQAEINKLEKEKPKSLFTITQE